MFALCASILFHLPPRFPGLICLQALLDTCHSGNPLLDLPHHHCNSAYVPWRSKCKRRTKSWQNLTGAFYHILSPLRTQSSSYARHSVRRNAACKGYVSFLRRPLNVLTRPFFPMHSYPGPHLIRRTRSVIISADGYREHHRMESKRAPQTALRVAAVHRATRRARPDRGLRT